MNESKVTILHVDDDEANRYAVTRSLRRAGFEVIEAATGTEALRRVRELPDLVILDVRLPDVDGFEVCRRIKGDPATADIPVLHLSASRVTSADKAFGLDGGAEGYLVRPVETVELVATINALLRARRSEAAYQERDRQFRALIDGVREYAIFAVDTEGRIASWHAGAQRLLGYATDEALGMPFDRLFTPEQRDAGMGAAELAAARADGEHKSEGPRVRRDGSAFDAACVLTATRAADGRIGGFLKLMQDVSVRKQAEAARDRQLRAEQAARLEAERVGRMKDEFLATLGHEIRTPLNAILGWSQVMRSPNADAGDVARGLDVIERNARAQAQIINDLLDMSRIVSGKIRLDIKSVDLGQAVRTATDSVRPAADAKAIDLTAAVHDAESLIHADADRLQQVLWNLLTNAIKFTPKGGRVRVGVRQAASSFEVSVTDTGEGIAPQFLPHVFDRFRQADASTTRRHGGLGLGLSIVKQLVETHGGTVRVESDGPGLGATFTVRLPVAAVRQADADDAGPAAPAAPPDPAHASLAGLSVLVVDDEKDARGLLERLLEGLGVRVNTAATVAAAVKALRADRFDLLLSDIGMPGEDGYTLVRQLHEIDAAAGRHTPAIALTAYARAEDRDKALASGFDAHVTKPIDARDLVSAVTRLVGPGRAGEK